MTTPGDALRTRTSAWWPADDPASTLLALTILWHPDARRIGAQVVLTEIDHPTAVNRFEPAFEGGGTSRALEIDSISRRPLHIVARADGGARIEPSDGRMPCEVGGVALSAPCELRADQVACGVVVVLGDQVVLCLHRVTALAEPTTIDGMVGVSSAMARLRREIRLASASDDPVLVRGETGTGKELVAQAIHRMGARSAARMQAVNMATLTEELAAADLFGVQRGAFTGANASRPGLFAQARGSTLFLDEIGDTPAAVQPKLLTALESGWFRPVGASTDERSDARIVAATDADLERGFNRPLLYRLQGIVIDVPPLRTRREDIGVLLRHLLGPALADPHAAAQVPMRLVRALCLHDWPGNVRQLRNAAGRLALEWKLDAWPSVERMLGEPLRITARADGPGDPGREPAPAPAPAPIPIPVPAPVSMTLTATATDDFAPEASLTAPPLAPGRAVFRPSSEVDAAMIESALRQCGWCVRQAAALLGLSRPTFYALVTRYGILRPAARLSADEIAAALPASGGDLTRLAAMLGTSRDALHRRLRELGITLATDPALRG